MSAERSSTTRHAFAVAFGILLSRIAGLVRESVFALYFGTSDAADVFKAAIRIPNFLQNLFGEGVLSASFIPVYAKLLAQEKPDDANRVAGAIGGILALLTSIIVLIGVLTTRYLVATIAPGFTGQKREMTIFMVQILFPGAGLLVFSAWCLGILNSHRRFFLSYTAPVVWNVTLIVALVICGRFSRAYPLATYLAWASVVGSGLQFLWQLPTALALARGVRLSLDTSLAEVRTVLANFAPVFVSRGVVQISAYVDGILASLLPSGALSAFTYAQTLYTLPVSLFGMSVSAAELPAMSSTLGSVDEVAAQLRARLGNGLRQIAFFIVPSAMAFLALGDVITAAIYQRGRFDRADAVYVWGILAGSAIGLLASTLGRLYASAYYALRDTRTPLKFAVLRVTLTTILGYVAAFYLPAALSIQARWGAAGLTASAGVAGWVEFVLLRRTLNHRIGITGLPRAYLSQLWLCASAATAVAWGVKWLTSSAAPIPSAAGVLGAYGSVYLSGALLFRVPEVTLIATRLHRRSLAG
ncbi:MAG TPA: murein biosynthesis integral membrane protein MurJ [Candidatus Binatia bacterium]|nr:murein biosynthesis integral membrane protein MurJ [Candidatus Binatia bacterium]